MATQRLGWFLFFVGCMCAVVGARLAYLQLIQHDFYTKKAQRQLTRVIHTAPSRGDILDRHQHPFALTTPSYHIYAVPKTVRENPSVVTSLAAILKEQETYFSKRLAQSTASFMWLWRHATPAQAQTIAAQKLPGIGLISAQKRVYPMQEMAAQVVGFVGFDNQGLAGLEYKYDRLLKGKKGTIVVDTDPQGAPLISGKQQTIRKREGSSMITTLDTHIQYHAEQALMKAVVSQGARAGQLIIMDPKTGDILAMASIPTYNANHWKKSDTAQRRARPVTDVFEPGSIFKPLTLASVLEEEIVTPGTMLDVPPTLAVYDKVITEAHDPDPAEPLQKSVTQILEQSLNTGTSLLAMQLGSERFYKYMKDFGLGVKTGIELSGEARGILRPVTQWSGTDIAVMSFGQGVAVTGIQMASAIATIANEGVRMKPRLIKSFINHTTLKQQGNPIQSKGSVVSKKTAQQVALMMQSVVDNGTAKALAIPGYPFAAKTGTAQKIDHKRGGYKSGDYIASFVGFFPVLQPRAVIVVIIDEPQKAYYGAQVAGPVFKDCMLMLLDYFDIPPQDGTGLE